MGRGAWEQGMGPIRWTAKRGRQLGEQCPQSRARNPQLAAAAACSQRTPLYPALLLGTASASAAHNVHPDASPITCLVTPLWRT